MLDVNIDRRASEAMSGELNIGGVDIQADVTPIRREFWRNGDRMPTATDRAVETGLSRFGIKQLENRLNEHGFMGGLIGRFGHGAKILRLRHPACGGQHGLRS